MTEVYRREDRSALQLFPVNPDLGNLHWPASGGARRANHQFVRLNLKTFFKPSTPKIRKPSAAPSENQSLKIPLPREHHGKANQIQPNCGKKQREDRKPGPLEDAQ
jgi:hypothetical protein